MKNLQERFRAALDRGYKDLTCPYAEGSPENPDIRKCWPNCAHYDPDQDECIHVLSAQAQVRAADALERLAECTANP